MTNFKSLSIAAILALASGPALAAGELLVNDVGPGVGILSTGCSITNETQFLTVISCPYGIWPLGSEIPAYQSTVVPGERTVLVNSLSFYSCYRVVSWNGWVGGGWGNPSIPELSFDCGYNNPTARALPRK